MGKVDLIERKELYTASISVNCDRVLRNIWQAVRKICYILQINLDFCNLFASKPVISFKRNKNMQNLIHGHLVKGRKVAKRKLEKLQKKSKTCNTTRSALCCMQVVNPNTFKSNETERVFNIYRTIRCENQWIICLLECTLCNLQYILKSETRFNIGLHNHWKDVSNPKAILAYIYFRKEGHNFIQHAKFTETETVTNRNGKC